MALIDSAPEAVMPVIFVRTHHDETNDSAVWLNRLAVEPGQAPAALTCRTGSWGADLYEVRPLPDEVVMTKFR